MFGLNEYGLALGLGVIFLVLYICVFLFERAWFLLYGFIDESKPTEHSQVMRFFCLRKGYTDRDSSAYWFNTPDGDISNGTGVFLQYGATLLAPPLLCLIAFKLYVITLFLVSQFFVNLQVQNN